MKHYIVWVAAFICLLVIALPQQTEVVASPSSEKETPEMTVGSADYSGSSPAVRALPDDIRDYPLVQFEINPRHNPHLFEPDFGKRGTWDRANVPLDPLIANSRNLADSPAPLLSFAGVSNPDGCGGCRPPDVVGDVGLNHYIQMVNATKVAIFDKSGNLLNTLFNLGNLWPAGNTCRSNAGDPIVVYDEIADRWLLSQFASPTHICFAISQTSDPLDSYYVYTYNVGEFPDYFKVGVWPDGYYMSANESTYTAYAFDRVAMLAGDDAPQFIKFTGEDNLLLPSDLDGTELPPPNSPNYFYTFKDGSYHGGGVDRLEVFAFSADFTNTSNSTFNLVASIPVSSFTYTACGFFNFDCIAQQGTSQRVDSLGEWPMFSFRYRNFETHEAVVGTFGVGGGTGQNGAAIRWFELHKTSGDWTLYQEGTHDVGDGHNRFNSSIAMDACGNIAIGYVASSSSLNPSVRYATRLVSDPLGTLRDEQVLFNGNGSQTGSNRWGDYATLSVDPFDGATFWFTNEYYASSSSTAWNTRIGTFVHQECLSPTYALAVVPTIQTACAGGTTTFSITANGFNGFTTPITLSADVTGATPSFSANPITPPGSSILTLSNLSAGERQFDLTGIADGQTKTQPLTINVASGLPAPTTLLTPSNNAANVGTLPTFSWSPESNSEIFHLEVATDSGFSNLVIDEMVVGTSFTGTALLTNTTYYWRVSAENGCGQSTSTSAQFTTIPTSLACNSAMTFEQRIPSDWVTLTSSGTTGWGTTDDGICGSSNGAAGNFAGTGIAACVDSDADGGLVDSYLCTPPIDLSGYGNYKLSFKVNFSVYEPTSEDLFEVVVSTNGADGPYTPALFSKRDDYPAGQHEVANSGALETLDLSAYRDQTINICFHYVGNFDWYAHVDDVALSCSVKQAQISLVDSSTRQPLPFGQLLGGAVVGLLVASSIAISWRRRSW
jgi:hypothetical protein